MYYAHNSNSGFLQGEIQFRVRQMLIHLPRVLQSAFVKNCNTQNKILDPFFSVSQVKTEYRFYNFQDVYAVVSDLLKDKHKLPEKLISRPVNKCRTTNV